MFLTHTHTQITFELLFRQVICHGKFKFLSGPTFSYARTFNVPKASTTLHKLWRSFVMLNRTHCTWYGNVWGGISVQINAFVAVKVKMRWTVHENNQTKFRSQPKFSAEHISGHRSLPMQTNCFGYYFRLKITWKYASNGVIPLNCQTSHTNWDDLKWLFQVNVHYLFSVGKSCGGKKPSSHIERKLRAELQKIHYAKGFLIKSDDSITYAWNRY